MHALILILLGIFEIWLAARILVRYQKTPSIHALIGVLSGFAVMTFLVAVMTFVDDSTGLWLGRLSFFAGCFTFVNFLKLAIYYPIHSSIPKKTIQILYWAPLIIFFFIIFLSDKFIQSIRLVDGLPQPTTGALFPLFTAFVVLYLFGSILIMFGKLKIVRDEQRQQAKRFAILLLLSGVIGVVTNFILPMNNIPINTAIGLEAGGVLLLFVASVVVKK